MRSHCHILPRSQTDWDASVVGRFGRLIAPDTLVYGLGGVAFQNMRIDAVCGSTLNGECIADHAESLSSTLTGWTLGSGIETMLGRHWLARFDYRYADLGTIRHSFFVAEPIQSPTTATRVHTHTASFGIAYKFGPGN
jgi:outer membrane immunogenic protein